MRIKAKLETKHLKEEDVKAIMDAYLTSDEYGPRVDKIAAIKALKLRYPAAGLRWLKDSVEDVIRRN